MKKIVTHLLALSLSVVIISPSAMASAFSEPVPAKTATTPGPDPAAIKAAVHEFKTLSRHERRQRLKEAKKVLKQYRADKKAGTDADVNKLLLVILAIILPPLAVYLHEHAANSKFWISLILSLLAIVLAFSVSGLFWLLAVIYSLLVVLDVI